MFISGLTEGAPGPEELIGGPLGSSSDPQLPPCLLYPMCDCLYQLRGLEAGQRPPGLTAVEHEPSPSGTNDLVGAEPF